MPVNKDVDIKVEYLTRVEGHGNIVVNIKDGKVEKSRLEIIEAPRFFEAMVRGRSMFEVQHITSRICGICSTGHCMASIKATEAATGFTPSEQTTLFRKLLLHLETLDSHLLHFYVLVAPDALGAPSIFPLLATHKDIIIRALKMKKQISDLCDILAGRHTHPITCCVRGFTKLPSKKELQKMKDIFAEMQPDVIITANTFKTINLPDFTRETEFVALTHPDEYAFLDGEIKSSDMKGTIKPKDYLKIVHEYNVEHSTSKHSKNKRSSYMVGALARININYDKLRSEAKQTAQMLGFKTPCFNPYMNTVAQVIEFVHCYYDAIAIIERFIKDGVDYSEVVTPWPPNSKMKDFKVQAGTGVGAVEVPRGLLFHEYQVSADGKIERANCVIPTNQNLANIDDDFKKLIPEIISKSKEEITLLSEMLVRAYDPCISCSCHYLDVSFVE